MQFEASLMYHIYNQGNNKQPVFFKPENYLFFIRKMRTFMLPYVDFLCYCLMPNHFHFLVMVTKVAQPLPNGKERSLNESIAIMLRSYSRAINKQEGRSGALFREETKAKNGIIDGFITLDGKDSDHFFKSDNKYGRICFDYIHNNPVKPNLATKASDWPFSSAADYAGLRNGTLCNMDLARTLNLF